MRQLEEQDQGEVMGWPYNFSRLPQTKSNTTKAPNLATSSSTTHVHIRVVKYLVGCSWPPVKLETVELLNLRVYSPAVNTLVHILESVKHFIRP